MLDIKKDRVENYYRIISTLKEIRLCLDIISNKKNLKQYDRDLIHKLKIYFRKEKNIVAYLIDTNIRVDTIFSKLLSILRKERYYLFYFEGFEHKIIDNVEWLKELTFVFNSKNQIEVFYASKENKRLEILQIPEDFRGVYINKN